MSDDPHTLLGAYRAAVARSRAASALVENSESGTPLFGHAVADLARCMRAEVEAGRAFLAVLDGRRSPRS